MTDKNVKSHILMDKSPNSLSNPIDDTLTIWFFQNLH